MTAPRDIAATFSLTNEQSTLYVVLHSRSERLAQMYLGAVVALNDERDPERLCKAAHEIRELMEKMSEIADVEIHALNESLGQKVADLEHEFDSMVKKSALAAPEWKGPVDPPMQCWLNKAREFFDWKKAHQPKRRDETRGILRALDGPNRALPAEIENDNVKLWMDVKNYFTNVAHHKFDTSDKEFLDQMAHVESVLINKLNPPTFANFDAIDAVIDEGERK